MVAVVAGCSGSGQRAATSTGDSDDPLAQPEAPLAAETLPGTLDRRLAARRSRAAPPAGSCPTAMAARCYARFVGDDGSRVDRDVDRGTLVGAAALDDGFALVVAAGGTARVHFLGARRERRPSSPRRSPATAVPGVASDGSRVLVARHRRRRHQPPAPTCR